MNKKSQISLLIIISLIIIIIGIMLFFNENKSDESEIFKGSKSNNVKEEINLCLDNVLLDGIKYISLRGGFYETPNKYLSHYSLSIPFYMYEGEKQVPSIDFIEKQLSLYIDDNFIECIENFSNYKVGEYNVRFGNVSSNVSILKTKIKSKINFPVTIIFEDKKESFNKFNSYINFNFLEKYDFVNEFLNLHNLNTNFVPISDLTSLANNNNFTYEYLPQKDGEVIYMFYFDEKKFVESSESFIYSFSIKYNWSEEE